MDETSEPYDRRLGIWQGRPWAKGTAIDFVRASGRMAPSEEITGPKREDVESLVYWTERLAFARLIGILGGSLMATALVLLVVGR